MEASPIWEAGQRPVGFRLMRRLGVKAVPPHYRLFRMNFFLGALGLGVVFGVCNVPVGDMVSEYGVIADIWTLNSISPIGTGVLALRTHPGNSNAHVLLPVAKSLRLSPDLSNRP